MIHAQDLFAPDNEVPFITMPRLLGLSPPVGAGRARPSPVLPVATGAGQEASPSLPAMPYVPVAALEDVLALRMRQIHHFGHTLAADAAAIDASGKRYLIAGLARRALGDAIEDMQFNKAPAQIRTRLVKAAALILAAIDAEDAVAEAKAAAEQLHGTARNV